MSDFIEIAGIKFPRPISSLPKDRNAMLHFVDLQISDGVLSDRFDESDYHLRAIYNGIAHLNEDAAKLHAKALIRLNHGFVCPCRDEEVGGV
jgi:hypothetical protein